MNIREMEPISRFISVTKRNETVFWKNLIRFGMSPEMPAAVVSNGTCKDQKALTSTVALLPEKVKEARIGAPAVIVVGKVCTYGERFQWIEKLPLGGRQYIVTRPGKQNKRLAEQLRMLGARVIECSAISTEALQSEEERRKIREALYGIKERIESQETNEWISSFSSYNRRSDRRCI